MKLEEDDHLSHKYTSSPAYKAFWMLSMTPGVTGVNYSVFVSIELEYYMKFYDRKSMLNYDLP